MAHSARKPPSKNHKILRTAFRQTCWKESISYQDGAFGQGCERKSVESIATIAFSEGGRIHHDEKGTYHGQRFGKTNSKKRESLKICLPTTIQQTDTETTSAFLQKECASITFLPLNFICVKYAFKIVSIKIIFTIFA